MHTGKQALAQDWDRRVHISDLEMKPSPLNLGDLLGNRFNVVLRLVPEEAVVTEVCCWFSFTLLMKCGCRNCLACGGAVYAPFGSSRRLQITGAIGVPELLRDAEAHFQVRCAH